MRSSALFLFAPLLLASPARAQSGADGQLTVSGSIRARYEMLDGQARTGFGPKDDLFSLRTLVLVEYDTGPLRIGAELQDSRVYGADLGSALSANDVNVLEPIQAYVAADIAAPFGNGSKLVLQAGRFTLNLGSRRLVAADDYRNTTNAYTGVRADVTLAGGWQATGIYVLPQQRLPEDSEAFRANRMALDREGFDQQLWGGLLSRTDAIAGAAAEIGFFRLIERDTPRRATRDRKLSSVSARVIRAPAAGKWDFEAETIYQSGRVRSDLAATASELGVSASFVHADIGYSFPGTLKARLSIEYDRASGDGAGGRFGRFDTLFGMRRADLAPAGIYAQIGRTNISTPGIRLEVAPTRRLDAFGVYRALWLAEPTDSFSTTGVRDATGRSGSFAGHQIEGRIRWWLVADRVRSETNAAFLAKGRFLREAPNALGAGSSVAYLSTALTFQF